MLGIGALWLPQPPSSRFKWIGAAYHLSKHQTFRAGGTLSASRHGRRFFGQDDGACWLVTALNPKSITFFVAFLPQFLDRHADFWTQMAIFEATFLALAFANAFGYALVAARARNMVRNPRAIRIFNRAGGSLLVGAGVVTVAMRSGN